MSAGMYVHIPVILQCVPIREHEETEKHSANDDDLHWPPAEKLSRTHTHRLDSTTSEKQNILMHGNFSPVAFTACFFLYSPRIMFVPSWLIMHMLHCVRIMLLTTFSRAVSRCTGAAMICLAWMSSVVLYRVVSLSRQTSWTGRLAQTVVHGNCFFMVMGQL